MDHGKTTLIAALTGIDADRLPEEKSRGMTIDIGFAHLDLPKSGRVGIVDVPGHERFVKNMLAGASGVDVAVLCVAADEGVMPQTREHFDILRLLESRAIVVALTKCDVADEEMQDIAESDVAEMMKGTSYQGSQTIRVSARTGSGLEELEQKLDEIVSGLGAREASDGKWFMPVDRVFSKAGHGTIVTGTLALGCVAIGEEAWLYPGEEKARIRGIQNYGASAERAEAGQRTALNIAGTKRETLHRGQMLASQGTATETRCVDVRITALSPLKHGQRVRAHIGAGEFIAKVFLFDNAPDVAQLRFEEVVACAKGQRFVLRRYSPPNVIAGGEITTPNARPRRKNDKTNATGDSRRERIVSFVRGKQSGVDTEKLCEYIGASAQELGDDLQEIKAAGELLSFAGTWIGTQEYRDLAARVCKTLSAQHEKRPSAAFVSKRDFHAASGLKWDAKPFERLLAKMQEDGMLEVAETGVRHIEFRPTMNEKQRVLLSRLVEEMARHGALAPPSMELAKALAVPPQAVEEMLRLGVESGEIVKVEDSLYYPKKTLDALEETVRGLGPRFTVAQFRDATGSSRKYALPILQYFDDKKVTRRVGDERVVL